MKHGLLYLLFLTTCMSGGAQVQDYREQVFLHMNDQVFIPGEYVTFSAYVMGDLNHKPSMLSQILYVELIRDNKPLIQKKVKINKGRGSGSFFIPSTIESGNYHFIAYTRWMLNFEDYFHTELSIINPFTEYTNPDNPPKYTVFPFDYQPVKDIKNVFRLATAKGNSISQIKLLNNHQEEVGSITEIATGFEVIFTPKKSESYQLVITDSNGQIDFFKLPETIEEGTFVQISEEKDQIIIEFESSYLVDSYTLSNKYGPIERPIEAGVRTLALDKSTLHDIPSEFALVSDGKSVHTGILYEPTPRMNLEKPTLRTDKDSVYIAASLPEGSYSFTMKKRLIDSTDYYFPAAIQTQEADFTGDLGWGRPKSDRFHQYHDTYIRRIPVFTDSMVQYLPEQRSGILQGKVYGFNEENFPVLTLTVDGEEIDLSTATVNASNQFHIMYDIKEETHSAYMSTQSASDNLQLEFDEIWLSNRLTLRDSELYIPKKTIPALLERSKNIQIENAYALPDTAVNELSKRIYIPISEFDYYYTLDDYNRFPTLEDHFLEYVTMAGVRKNALKVFVSERPPGEEFPPIVLMDGVPVDPSGVLAFNPYKIKSIGVIGGRYYHGPLIADGLIFIETFEGNLSDYRPGNSIYKFEIQGVDFGFSSVKINYPLSTDEIIPDRREHLAFLPFIELSEPKTLQLSIPKSEVSGVYEWSIQGYDSSGKPVSLQGRVAID